MNNIRTLLVNAKPQEEWVRIYDKHMQCLTARKDIPQWHHATKTPQAEVNKKYHSIAKRSIRTYAIAKLNSLVSSEDLKGVRDIYFSLLCSDAFLVGIPAGGLSDRAYVDNTDLCIVNIIDGVFSAIALDKILVSSYEDVLTAMLSSTPKFCFEYVNLCTFPPVTLSIYKPFIDQSTKLPRQLSASMIKQLDEFVLERPGKYEDIIRIQTSNIPMSFHDMCGYRDLYTIANRDHDADIIVDSLVSYIADSTLHNPSCKSLQTLMDDRMKEASTFVYKVHTKVMREIETFTRQVLKSYKLGKLQLNTINDLRNVVAYITSQKYK